MSIPDREALQMRQKGSEGGFMLADWRLVWDDLWKEALLRQPSLSHSLS